MGTYLNPGCKGFQTIRNGIYVDKTGLIEYINSTINTPLKLTSFSRPRRFGKSFAAKMLCAYYDKSCDSRRLFEDLEIAKKTSFEQYLNKYDVIYLDMTRFTSTAKCISEVVKDLQKKVIEELQEEYPSCLKKGETILADALLSVSHKTGREFIFIIDEWDAIFREAKENDALQKEYIQLLRGLFKAGTATDETIAAAYMTGILPVKKYGNESAVSDFKEFTMTSPARLTRYVGFTEQEVKKLCRTYHMNFDEMSAWYDGYSFRRMQHVYSPNSVMNALQDEEIQNYWRKSETFESLKQYIDRDFDGLKDSVILMLGGQRVKIDIGTFQNDISSFKSRDDILTLLIHLGYLAYDQSGEEVYIPNREVAEVFQSSVKGGKWEPVERAISQSEELLDATLRCDNEAVARSLELVHEECTSVLKYNEENSLACSIYIAYYTARNYYLLIRELPSGGNAPSRSFGGKSEPPIESLRDGAAPGKGFADYAFLPGKNTDKPAILVELKYDQSADSAIRQIHNNRYDGKLKDYFGNLLLVGINYDKDAKGKKARKHSCVIEQV